MIIGLIDYSIGNLLSVFKAVEQVAGAGAVRIFDRAAELERFDALILPGVGNFGDGMEQLNRSGFAGPLREWARRRKPLLGICLGMQLLLESSEEAPGVVGLGVVPGKVVRFPEGGEKVPHMGWNQLRIRRHHPLLAGLSDLSYFYFVHSYYVAPADPEWTLGSCEYILDFPAVIGRGRVGATQFHPEKSQTAGLTLLKNFVRLAGQDGEA
ncbi:imidazole glycerol phosphate synthase subunit HisH [Victivallis sp. Marseille-Q1083]|uniref:imidazole glycerol phosphate synthase subunit HisH n=1 Tax=Victivallis sp. Marseille-Q1083 TaxID=2717288 RepID=UPI001589EDF3|nr:imidazole glycerol phosphate synthase subunit HisH [Victivallis sp. Marseille-Q1083]